MSWLYSIVFAGLLLASDQESVMPESEILLNREIPAVSEKFTSDETERFQQSYPLSAKGTVSVSNINGSIIVEAWDRDEVKLVAEKIADSRESLAEVEIKVDSRADHFSVEANYDKLKNRGKEDWRQGKKLEVNFHLTVPRTAVLNEIETINGSVTVSNFTNLTKISAVNGHVKAANLRGAAHLSTVNGEVTADFERLEAGSKITLSTVNGRVNLVIPSDSNATVKADTLNGSISNEFGLPVRKGKYIGRDLYGKIGSGDAPIKLNSVNGSLMIGRRNDGKNLNPATDLLQQKSRDEENWETGEEKEDKIDVDAKIDTAKINRAVAKAVKTAAKDSEAALKQTHKELAKVKPVVKIDVEALKIWRGGIPRIEKKSNSFSVKGVPKVAVDANGCAVKVRGWDKPEVKYVVTQLAGGISPAIDVKETHSESEVNLKVEKRVQPMPQPEISVVPAPRAPSLPEAASDIKINKKRAVVINEGGVTEQYDLTNPEDKAKFEKKYHKLEEPKKAYVVRAPRMDWNWEFSGDAGSVRIEVFVPQKSNLKIVSDKEIRIEGVSGDVELIGRDEAINVRESDGKLRVSANEGFVRVIGFRGELDSETVCGSTFLEGDFERISAKTKEGMIALTLPETVDVDIYSDRPINIDNMPAAKEISTGVWRIGKGGRKYNFTAEEGQIVIRGASSLKG